MRRSSAYGTRLHTSAGRVAEPPALTPRQLKRRRSAKRKILIGAILLGLGVIILAGGAVTVAGFGYAFIFTPGAIAAATGLILLSVGLGQLDRGPP